MKRNVSVLGLCAAALLAALIALTGCGQAEAAEKTAEAQTIELRLWSLADRSGPLRAGNLVKAAEFYNKQLEDAGIEAKVVLEVHDNSAKGYDADALDLLKAFATDQSPDLYVAAHEWLGKFVSEGYAMDMESHIARYPEYYSDIIPALWDACKVKGTRYAVPQDSEVRMFFYNKEMLRKIGKSEELIEGLPAMVDSGEFTIWDFSKLAKEVVDRGAAQYGLIHRPNVGPDFQMTMAVFGFEPYDSATGKLKAGRKALTDFYSWIKWNADNGVTPKNNTAMAWDAVHAAFRGRKSFAKHHGLWNVPSQLEEMSIEDDEAAYFREIGWIHAPAAEKGGEPKNLSHPIVYCVNPESEHKELAAILVAIASQPYFNTEHAITTGHTGINYGQISMPEYSKAWYLAKGTSMVERSVFMPNHEDIGIFNQIIYKSLQGVETGRIGSGEEAASLTIEELQNELGDDVIIE